MATQVVVNIHNNITKQDHNCNGFDIIELNLNLRDKISDIKNALIEHLTKLNITGDYFLCSQFLIFEDQITINQCMKQLQIKETDILTLNLVQIFIVNEEEKEKKETDKKMRTKNDAHVQKRRESRVMIIKSKISSEIQRGSRRMVEYVEDSPFFWSRVKESENRIRRLSLRLNQLCDMILDLCSVTITFSEHCNRIHNLAKKSWEDVENEYSSDILSLNTQFNELGEQFLHMSNASKQLAVTMKAVLVDAFRDFSQTHLSQMNSSSKAVHILEKQYEAALRKVLHSPKNLPQMHSKSKTANKTNRITDLQQYEECRVKTMNLKTKYFLGCFDHVNILNRVINRHRYELILNLCAAFSAFETFFHVGYEASLAHKVFHRSIQMGVAQKTLNEDKNDKKLSKNRKEMQKKLNNNNDNNSNNNDIDDNVDFYAGYLWKQSSNMKKDWKRRWFVLENGELAYYRSRDKLDREFVVNTMLCKVKEKFDHDYRFVFELISPSRRVYVLQAESEQDFNSWCGVLKNQVHRLLRKSTTQNMKYNYNNNDDDNNYNADEEKHNKRQRKKELKKKICQENNICADCSKKEPEWVSINTGVVICIDCCGIHRGLGTHISKVRSLMLDDINESTLKSLLELGNNRVNNILEDVIPSDYSKIDETASSSEKEKFIKGKYMFKLFLNNENNQSYEQSNAKLYDGAVQNNLLLIFEALCFGANIDFQFEQHSNRTALHETSANNYIEATEFLLQNGANQRIKDDDDNLARYLATESECTEILDYHVGY